MVRLVRQTLWTVGIVGIITLIGCRAPERNCVPNHLLREDAVPHDPSVGNRLATLAHHPHADAIDGPPMNVLALSGGGVYGAFGAGVINGWTASGTRPTFDVVTGISTGSLIATYAFLGPTYDRELERVYTTISDRDVYRRKRRLSPLFTDSAASSDPLARTIAAQVTPELIREVAAAHAQGRRLYVGTTNLDRLRLTVWDMGAIASRGDIKLYRQILLASASVPGFFPPVSLNVEIDGQTYEELHADGGVSTGIFVQSFMLNRRPQGRTLPPGSKFWAVCNGKLYADPDCARRKAIALSSRAISGLLYAQTRNDLIRIYILGLASGADFNLIALRQDFPLDAASLEFDPETATQLFEEGFRSASQGLPAWQHEPPGLGDQNLPRVGTQFRTEGAACDCLSVEDCHPITIEPR